jgi:hypothetical protein
MDNISAMAVLHFDTINCWSNYMILTYVVNRSTLRKLCAIFECYELRDICFDDSKCELSACGYKSTNIQVAFDKSKLIKI